MPRSRYCKCRECVEEEVGAGQYDKTFAEERHLADLFYALEEVVDKLWKNWLRGDDPGKVVPLV